MRLFKRLSEATGSSWPRSEMRLATAWLSRGSISSSLRWRGGLRRLHGRRRRCGGLGRFCHGGGRSYGLSGSRDRTGLHFHRGDTVFRPHLPPYIASVAQSDQGERGQAEIKRHTRVVIHLLHLKKLLSLGALSSTCEFVRRRDRLRSGLERFLFLQRKFGPCRWRLGGLRF